MIPNELFFLLQLKIIHNDTIRAVLAECTPNINHRVIDRVGALIESLEGRNGPELPIRRPVYYRPSVTMLSAYVG